jgi:dethiobiotin synthetase
MTVDCVRAAQLKIAGIVLNSYNAVEATVAEETASQVISQCSGENILCTVPFDETVDIETQSLGEMVVPSLMNCDWSELARV